MYKYCWQIDHFTLIGPKINKEGKIEKEEEIEGQYLLNHSSKANIWFLGDQNIETKREIKAGEELVIDYASIEVNGMSESFESKGDQNEERKLFLPFDFESHFDDFSGHSLSYVEMLRSFTLNHRCHDLGSPLFELNRDIYAKVHPLGYGRGIFAKAPIAKVTFYFYLFLFLLLFLFYLFFTIFIYYYFYLFLYFYFYFYFIFIFLFFNFIYFYLFLFLFIFFLLFLFILLFFNHKKFTKKKRERYCGWRDCTTHSG